MKTIPSIGIKSISLCWSLTLDRLLRHSLKWSCYVKVISFRYQPWNMLLTLSFPTTHTGLADTLTHLGDMVIETTQSKYRLGDGITQKDQQRALDRKMQLFGLLMDELGFLVTRQVSKQIQKTWLDHHPHFEINVLLGKGGKHAIWWCAARIQKLYGWTKGKAENFRNTLLDTNLII